KNTGGSKRPTMYASYFGVQGRSLEADDKAALQCSNSRYPVGVAPAAALAPVVASAAEVPEAPTLSSRPRPGGALIRFRLPADQDAEVRLFDVAGRSIETLTQGARRAGEYELAWDGASRFGRARSGVYFARLVTPTGVAHTTVILAE